MEALVNSEPSAKALRDCLYRVGRVSEHVHELDPLLLAIIQECATLLDCEAASVATVQGDGLIFSVASGVAGERVKQTQMAMGEGVVGRVAEEKAPYATNDPASDPFWSSKVDKASSFQTRNLAAVPMIRAEKLVGVLEAINCRRPGGFQGPDLEVMQLFADQVAIAIENHQLILEKQEIERRATFDMALADISHTIKNILQRLESPDTLISRGIKEQNWGVLEAMWPVVQRANKDVGKLVRDMLTLSGDDHLKLAMTDVAALCREIVKLCRPDAESKAISLTLAGGEGEMPWMLDADKVRYALQNLIGNSIEAFTEQREAAAIRLAIEADEAKGMLRIIVADNGSGIPADIQKRVFKPFFTTKKGKGTGLGLANVKKGVEAHGGRVLLESEPGRTVFTLCYPRPAAVAD